MSYAAHVQYTQVNTTRNRSRRHEPAMLVCARPLCTACSAPGQQTQHGMRLCHLKRTKAAVPWPLRMSHPTQPRSQWPARSPSLAHDLATRHHGASCATSYFASSSARIAQPKPAQPARHPATVERARVHSPQLRRSRSARAAPAPPPRHSCAATVTFRAACAQTREPGLHGSV